MTGRNIGYARRKMGHSQKDMAKAIGVSPGMLSLWESDRRVPSPQHVLNICKYLNVSVDFILNCHTLAEFEMPQCFRKR